MRLTTKGRFAVTAMIDLALRNNGVPFAAGACIDQQATDIFESAHGFIDEIFALSIPIEPPCDHQFLEFRQLRRQT